MGARPWIEGLGARATGTRSAERAERERRLRALRAPRKPKPQPSQPDPTLLAPRNAGQFNGLESPEKYEPLLAEPKGPVITELPEATKPVKPRGTRGIETYYSEDRLRAMHVRHREQGVSINALAKESYKDAGYTTHTSAATAISREWKRMGLPARDRIEQTVIASTKHGHKARSVSRDEQNAYRRWRAARKGWNSLRGPGQGRCKGIKRGYRGGNKGERCKHPAMEGSEYCAQHDPERQRALRERLAAMREKSPIHTQERVPIGPFAAWLRELRSKHGSWAAVAKVAAVSNGYPQHYGEEGRAEIGADTVRRWLERVGDGTTFEHLYPTKGEHEPDQRAAVGGPAGVPAGVGEHAPDLPGPGGDPS
jgi:hypothetical protein